MIRPQLKPVLIVASIALLLVSVACRGRSPLPTDTACPTLYQPVCGADQHTYMNACEARKAGQVQTTNGECPASTCPTLYQPVCGADQHTYMNACEARKAGQLQTTNGECQTASTCPTIYQPVCGADRHTYMNACEARKAGQVQTTNGECPATGLLSLKH